MQFIMDNYIWFAVGGIVIIMAIIGYFADKTDFGRKVEEKKEKEPKVKKEKKPKKEKPVKEPEKIEVEAKGIGELTQSMAEVAKEEVEETPSTDDLYAPLESTEKEEVDPALFEPLVPLSNEEVVEEKSEPTVVETKEEIEPISTNIELPATDAMATTEEASELELTPFTPSAIEEPIEESVEETVEPVVQTIEPLKEEPVQIPASEPVATEEEDIWKF